MKHDLFKSARWKLTWQYTAVICLVGLILSSLFYLRTARLISMEFERINRRFQLEEIGFMPPPGPMARRRQINPEDLILARDQLIKQLILINIAVGLVTFILSYWLAGKTLRPIQKAMLEQKRFVGDAAHELKTPVTALKTAMEVNLMDKNIKLKTKKILAENLEDVTSLETLIEGLLRLARVDDLGLSLKPVKVGLIVERAVKQVKTLAEKKRIGIKQTELIREMIVLGDTGSLTELLVIMLDNAIKYSQAKTTVAVTVKENKKMTVIEIKDEGVGIAQDQLSYIFDRFYQVDAARSKNTTNGYGLGLAMAKKIVEQHQGKIVVESEPGKGSTFLVHLPRV